MWHFWFVNLSVILLFHCTYHVHDIYIYCVPWKFSSTKLWHRFSCVSAKDFCMNIVCSYCICHDVYKGFPWISVIHWLENFCLKLFLVYGNVLECMHKLTFVMIDVLWEDTCMLVYLYSLRHCGGHCIILMTILQWWHIGCLESLEGAAEKCSSLLRRCSYFYNYAMHIYVCVCNFYEVEILM